MNNKIKPISIDEGTKQEYFYLSAFLDTAKEIERVWKLTGHEGSAIFQLCTEIALAFQTASENKKYE